MTDNPEPARSSDRKVRLLVIGVVVLGLLVPPALYWWFFGRVDIVESAEAIDMLRASNSGALLVDVRSACEFDARHVDGAVNWPAADIRACSTAADAPPEFRNRKLLMLCDVGYAGTAAAGHAASIGLDASNVRGGMQEWIAAAGQLGDRPLGRWADAEGQTTALPFRLAPPHEQFTAVASGIGVKATYTLLSLVIVIVLWRSVAGDLVALRWAMIFFFLGENCCAINYYVFGETSYIFEFLHSYGMLLCFGLATYAAVHGVDSRVLMLSDPERRCAALALCGRCAKHADVPCGLKRMFYLIIPACMVLAVMPLAADRQFESYNTMIYGTFYNYSHPLVYQLFEFVFCPVAAVILFAASLGVLVFRKSASLAMPKVLFAMGAGPMGFGLLRMIVLAPYAHNQVWFTFWEEVTELIFIVAVAATLWIFRATLLPARGHGGA